MLAKDDDWLTAGNQLDDSLLMDDLWDDDADPQNDKGAASHSTGSAFPQDNAETLPQKAGGTGSSPNVPTVPQSNRESILGENANTFPQYFDDSFPQSDESTTHQSDSNPFQQEDVDPFQQEYNQLSTQEKEEPFSRSNDSTVSRSNSASLSQEDAETIPHSTEHTVPQSDKTTDSQDSKGTASRPIRTTAPQNTVDPVQQDTADTTPRENAENPDQIDLLANGYDPFKEFADSAEDRNDKKSEEQSAVSAFPQNNEETREQGKGPEEYDPFEQFDLQSDDSSEPTTEQNERRDDNIIQDSSADSKKNVDMQEQGDIETVFPSNVPMQNQRDSETEEQYDSSSFQQEDSSPVRQDTGETYPKDTDSADPFDLWDDPSEPPEGEPQTSSPSAGSPSADDYPTQTFQTGDDFWSQTDDESNGQWNTGQQTNGMPPQQFDNPPFPQENTDTENRENGGTLIKIIAVAAAILIGLGALIGGGAYTYHAYTTHVAEQQAEADRKQRQQSLVKAQNKWDGRKRKADDLVSTIKASPVAENSDVQKAMEALRKTTTGNPMTEKDITSALEKLDGEYEKTNRTYTDAMQAKAKETRTTLDGLVQQANGLADAPDGNDKKQMQSLASQWKSTEITSDNLSDAITASTELKNLISKVDKAKKDADAKKKAEEEAKAKAEAERQAQAQQEQQQAQQPQQNPYGNMYYWGGGYGSTGGSTGGPTGGSTGNSGGGVSPQPQQETPPKGNSGGNVG